MPRLTSTHTFVELELSPAAYAEIRAKLEEAGYQHAFAEDGAIDMHGIGVTVEKCNEQETENPNEDPFKRMTRLRDEAEAKLAALQTKVSGSSFTERDARVIHFALWRFMNAALARLHRAALKGSGNTPADIQYFHRDADDAERLVGVFRALYEKPKG